ncbi:SusC/RagA family TonB-linked outer membrane protein [Mucilaginibacter gracilis]|nr:SusC/RagA family TonB-linked outer membrane protein [Mucilaginibacter gracilis]
MRITFSQLFILVVLTVVSYARPSSAQVILDKKISLNAERKTLADILKQLAKTNQIQFIYNKDVIQTGDRISVQFSDEPLKTVLDKLLARYDINYQVFKNKIVLIDAEKIDVTANTPKQTVPVSGKVLDEKGQPLIGVSVTIKGTTKGTVTDPDGNFKIQADNPSDILVFKYIGYLTFEAPAGSPSPITVKLISNSTSLNEVVVVGYGTQRTLDITGSVGSITDKSIRDQPVTTIGEAMAAKIAGVEVQQTTGKPGAPITVRIRGAGSISAGNQPLYVLDGYPLADPATLNLLSNDDIASIEVLKDASAAAIYGSRGGNGVVLITTKKGTGDGKTKFNLNFYSGLSSPSKYLDMLNSAEFVDVTLRAYNNAYIDRGGDPAVLPVNRAYGLAAIFFNPSQWDDTNWQKVVTQTAPFNNYQLSVSGGSNGNKYYLSAGFLQQDGIVKYTGFKRYSVRSNIEAAVKPNLKIGLNLAPSFSNERVSNTEGTYANATNEGTIMLAVLSQPFIGPYQADGSYTRPVLTGNASSRNALALLKEITDWQKTLRALGNLYIDWQPVKGLTLRTSGGADFVASRRDYFRPTTVPSSGVSVANGFNNTAQNINLLWENTANYKTTLAKDHKLELLAGYSAQWNDNEQNSIVGSGYPNDAVTTVNAATTRIGTENIEKWALASILARINYSYKDKYLLTANFRRDGSSRFGANTQYGSFPSASVGWRLSEESFLKSINWLNELKIRASYGLTGNNNIANYGSIGLITQDNYVLGTGTGTLTGGLAPSSISNPDLKWEKNVQTDLGLEASILHDRLQITADYYSRVSSDLLLNLQVPSILGFTSALVNIGEVQNKGVEFTVNSRNLVGGLKWNTNFNISFNRNKVLNTGPSATPIFTGSYVANINVTQVGSAIGSFYGYHAIGVFNNTAELNTYPHFANTRAGDVKYEDVNHDGIIDAHDMTLIGNNQPDFTYGITNTFQFRNFDLSTVLQGVQGDQIANAFSSVIENGSGAGINQKRGVLNAWQSPDNPGDGIHPRLNSSVTGSNNVFSSRFVEDGSYLRLRTVTLGYTLPAKLAEKFKIKSARFYLTGENLFTLTKYSGFNPEVGSAGDNATQPGVDYGAYPISRVYTIGVNIGF